MCVGGVRSVSDVVKEEDGSEAFRSKDGLVRGSRLVVPGLALVKLAKLVVGLLGWVGVVLVGQIGTFFSLTAARFFSLVRCSALFPLFPALWCAEFGLIAVRVGCQGRIPTFDRG